MMPIGPRLDEGCTASNRTDKWRLEGLRAMWAKSVFFPWTCFVSKSQQHTLNRIPIWIAFFSNQDFKREIARTRRCLVRFAEPPSLGIVEARLTPHSIRQML